jgi:hypothetical protein
MQNERSCHLLVLDQQIQGSADITTAVRTSNSATAALLAETLECRQHRIRLISENGRDVF